MSVDALSWAFGVDVPPKEKLILLTLADNAGEYSDCYQSWGDISERTGIPPQEVTGLVSRLAQRGVLTVHDTPRPGEAPPYATLTLLAPGAKPWRNGR